MDERSSLTEDVLADPTKFSALSDREKQKLEYAWGKAALYSYANVVHDADSAAGGSFPSGQIFPARPQAAGRKIRRSVNGRATAANWGGKKTGFFLISRKGSQSLGGLSCEVRGTPWPLHFPAGRHRRLFPGHGRSLFFYFSPKIR